MAANDAKHKIKKCTSWYLSVIGSGKTAVLEAAFLRQFTIARSARPKVVYLAPTKALLHERQVKMIGIQFVLSTIVISPYRCKC